MFSTETGWLRRFRFPFDTPAARVDAFVHAPVSFRRRGVFIHPQEPEVPSIPEAMTRSDAASRVDSPRSSSRRTGSL